MTTEQKMIKIFRAILVEMNGYNEKKCTDELVACCEATGNPMDIMTADIYSIANEALKNNQ